LSRDGYHETSDDETSEQRLDDGSRRFNDTESKDPNNGNDDILSIKSLTLARFQRNAYHSIDVAVMPLSSLMGRMMFPKR
jgi:hypothetical protein